MKRHVIKITEDQERFLNECQIFEGINNSILESLSISNDVRLFSDQLASAMSNEYEKTNAVPYDNGKALQKKFNFKLDFLGYNVYVSVSVVLCKPADLEHYMSNPDLTDCASLSVKRKINNITFNFVETMYRKGRIDNTKSMKFYLPTIQHEVNHLYQQLMRGNAYSYGNMAAMSFYGFSNSNIHSPDEVVRNVATAIYLTQTVEQDSFANELDAMLRSDTSRIKERDIYKESEPYKRLLQLKECHRFLLNNRNRVEQLIDFLKKNDPNIKIDYTTLINLCKTGEERIMKKIAQVIVKAHDSMQLEYYVRDCFGKETMKRMYLV